MAAAPARENRWRLSLRFWIQALDLQPPVVAVLWQALFARAFGLGLGWAQALVLALSVWMAYAGDHWLDAATCGAPGPDRDHPPMPAHRRFHRRQRRAMASVLALVLPGTVALAWFGLTRGQWHHGLWLSGGVLAYFLAAHSLARGPSPWPLKEPAVALLFAGGATVFFWGRAPAPYWRFAWATGTFACLCLLNCLCVAAWEMPWDRGQGQGSLPSRWPRLARALGPACGGLALACAAWALGPGHMRAGFYLAAAGSATGLGLLHGSRPRLPLAPEDARFLADLCLCTPLLCLAAG